MTSGYFTLTNGLDLDNYHRCQSRVLDIQEYLKRLLKEIEDEMK